MSLAACVACVAQAAIADHLVTHIPGFPPMEGFRIYSGILTVPGPLGANGSTSNRPAASAAVGLTGNLSALARLRRAELAACTPLAVLYLSGGTAALSACIAQLSGTEGTPLGEPPAEDAAGRGASARRAAAAAATSGWRERASG